MSRLGDIGGRLYRGDVSINFVGRQKLWYTISGCILVIAIVALLVRGLNFSVDFKGGSIFQVKAPNATITQVEQAVSDGGGGTATVQKVGVGSSAQWQAQTAPLTITQTEHVQDALAKEFGLSVNDINTTFVGPTWGSQISSKAIEALIAFLIVIVIYLSIAFEWKMASAAFVALMHDILITVGIYALAGFQVSPATVIGLLTILGYSLYDTVVVFDKVRENTAGLVTSGRSTYSQAANLALNQTLVRSINTSVIALLPVAAILIAGTLLLGTGELSDLALVLFVGMLSGTYSSIFIATPVLADLKEREPQYKALAKRVAARAASPRVAARTQTAVPAGSGVTAGAAARPADNRTGPDDGPYDDLADTGDDAGGDAGTAAAAPRRRPPRPGRPRTRSLRHLGSLRGPGRRDQVRHGRLPPAATPYLRVGAALQRRQEEEAVDGAASGAGRAGSARRAVPGSGYGPGPRRARGPDQEAHPRRARLPATRHFVQGHHPAARGRPLVRRGRGRARRRRRAGGQGGRDRGPRVHPGRAGRGPPGIRVRPGPQGREAAFGRAPAGLPARIRHGHDRSSYRRLRPGRPGPHRGRRAGHRRDRAGHRRSRAALRCGGRRRGRPA